MKVEGAASNTSRRRSLTNAKVKSEGDGGIAGFDLLPRPKRASVFAGVADHIRRLVYLGELADGQRVPQREIAEATKHGVAKMIAELEARRPAAAERACWALVDEIGELVAVRFER